MHAAGWEGQLGTPEVHKMPGIGYDSIRMLIIYLYREGIDKSNGTKQERRKTTKG